MKSFYNLIPGQKGQESALYISGPIVSGKDYENWWGEECAGAISFEEKLKECGDVCLYIDSPGGDVIAAAKMYSILKDHPGKVTVKITGIAASAASVVAMAGDEVLISPVGYLMIHNPLSYAEGNAEAHENEARILREVAKGIVAAYQLKTGLPAEEIQQMMDDETYLSAQTAVEKGFADAIWEFDRTAAQSLVACMQQAMEASPAPPAPDKKQALKERTALLLASAASMVGRE